MPETIDHSMRRVTTCRPQMLENVIDNWTCRLDYIIPKKSIVLEKQENIDIQQNSSSYRRRKSTLIRERFYQQPEEQFKCKDHQNIATNKDFCKQSDQQDSLVVENCQQQEFIEKVQNTSQQLSNLEESINHKIKKLQQQRSRLIQHDKNMERKQEHKSQKRFRNYEQATWAEQLADNGCKESKQEPLEIAKERYSVQHHGVCTSPRYGSDKHLPARPRMRSVASQIQANYESLDEGAVGDHKSVFAIKENKEKFLPEKYPNIAKQNDHMVNCCYGLTCQPLYQQTGMTKAATNTAVCQQHNYQSTDNEPSREYNCCRDESYYILGNCCCNTQCRTATAAAEYRRHTTDLNTQHFYCRPQERTCSPEPVAKTKFKKTAKACKTKEFYEEYNEAKKREKECEERLKIKQKQRSKSMDNQKKRATKGKSLCHLLGEEGALKIKCLDRYVDDCEKKLSLKKFNKNDTTQITDDSSTPTAVKVKSQTKLYEVTVRKKQEANKNLQDFLKCHDDVSLYTQYSLETLRMLRKMTIRDYKPVKPKEIKADNDLHDKNREKVKRYREYLEKYEREQQTKNAIKILKQPPEFFPQQKSQEVDIFKQAQKSREALTNLRRQMQTSSEQLEEFRDKTNYSYDSTNSLKTLKGSQSYEELRYTYEATGRHMNGLDDYDKYKEQKISRFDNYDQRLAASKVEQYYKDQSRESEENKRQTAAKQQDSILTDRERKAEDQRFRPDATQQDTKIYRKPRDRERKAQDQSPSYTDYQRRDSKETKQQQIKQLRKAVSKGVKDVTDSTGNESKSEDQRSRSAAIQEDTAIYRKYRERDQGSRDSKQTKQPIKQLRKADDKEVKDETEYNKTPFNESTGKERIFKGQRSRPTAIQEDTEIYRDKERMTKVPASRYYEDRHSKESKQYPIRHLTKEDLREARAKAEYENKIFRESGRSERNSEDQGSIYYDDKRSEILNNRTDEGSRYYEDKRMNSLERRQQPSELLNNGMDKRSRYYEKKSRESLEGKQYSSELLNNRTDKVDNYQETFRESKANITKTIDIDYKGNRRDSGVYTPEFKEENSRIYDFKGSSKDQRTFEEKTEQSARNYDFPVKHNVKQFESYEEPEYGEIKHRNAEEKRKILVQQPTYSGNLKDPEIETTTKVQAATHSESKESTPRLQEEINEKPKIKNYGDELYEQFADLEERETKPGYTQEPYKRQKRSLGQPCEYEKEKSESIAKSLFLKDAEVYDTKQKTHKLSEDFIKTNERITSPSFEKAAQVYPLKQEELKIAILSSRNEKLYKEAPAVAKMELNGLDKKFNSSSYNEFKHVMDHNLGFHTSRASQTDYTFKPEVAEQFSALTFAKGKETPDNQDQLQETQQLNDIKTEATPSLNTTTAEDALSYLKNFLKTCHQSGLEAECLDAVTSAAKDLITKLSSCKSLAQSKSTSNVALKEHDKSSYLLEQKVTQDTQYNPDPESITDSSEQQLKHNLKPQESHSTFYEAENNKTQEIALKELEAKEEPANIFLQQESYQYQYQPTEQQHIETLETYNKYLECEENLCSLTPPKEFTNEQESLQIADFTKTPPYLEMHDKLPLNYDEDYNEPAEDRECSFTPLPSPSRQLPFDPELMPLKGILKPCRYTDNSQMATYDLETHRTTSVVSFRHKDNINEETASAITYKLGQEEIAEQCNETKQTIITKDEFHQPIAKQSKYMLCETTSTKRPIHEDCQQGSELQSEMYSFNNYPHLYTVEMPTFKQCPCMWNTYKKMMENYYKGKRK